MDKSKKEVKTGGQVFLVIKVLLAMYILTGVLLMILTALLYKFDLGEKVICAGVVVIYVAAGFTGGFVLGKLKQNRKFLWGMAIGACYFAILLVASVIFQKGLGNDMQHFLSSMVLCIASGMAGGMLS